MIKHISILFILINFLLLFASCKGERKTEISGADSSKIEGNGSSDQDGFSRMKPDEMMFLVEGAVDSWFFYHLHDYQSYKPIIRSTDYNVDKDYYTHRCRYRASTLEGGYETEEKIFKVYLQIDSTGLKDFQVEDITGHKSITEKEE